MRRRDISFTLALCTSIVVHGWLVSRYIEEIREGIRGYFGQRRVLVAVKEGELGLPDGQGNATDESPGDIPLEARQADQTQILGSLDPEGAGQFRDRPSMSVLPTGGAISKPQPQPEQNAVEVGVATPPILTAPEGFGDLIKKKKEVADAQPSPQPADDSTPLQQTAPETTPAVPQASTAVASIAGAPLPSADPAPQAPTESDPFSVNGGVYFRNGRAYARFGRQHRITTPRLTLAGKTDLLQLGQVRLVLRLRIDTDGNVINAEVIRSSGSHDIDQTCRVEAYNWWFKPKVNRANQRVEDEFDFPIGYL